MTQQLCLSWNNHAAAFSKLLLQIYLEDTYSDATIVCQGKFYPVHRFVLSTCSEIFKEMFQQCLELNNKHPFIIVKDIQQVQLEALLNYMYKGEVNVPQEVLPDLIKAAESFKIKGLAVPDEDISQNSKKRQRSSEVNPPQKKSCNLKSKVNNNKGTTESKKSDHNPSQSSSYDCSINNDLRYNIKTEPIEDQTAHEQSNLYKNEEVTFDGSFEEEAAGQMFDYEPEQHTLEDFSNNDENFSYENQNMEEESSQQVKERTLFRAEEFDFSALVTAAQADDKAPEQFSDPSTGSTGNTFRCSYSECPYETKFNGRLKVHLRSHTGEKPFKCPYCPRKTKQKIHLDMHINSIHSTHKPFSCSLCQFESANKSYFKTHMMTKHCKQLFDM